MESKSIIVTKAESEVVIEDNAWSKEAREIRILLIDREPMRVYHQLVWGSPQSRAQVTLNRTQARRLSRMLTRFADAK